MSEEFRRAYAAHAKPVLGYALRRCERSEDAADVVAETFLIALRKWDQVPAEPETRAWLYGVARRVLANHRRGEVRRHRLADRLRGDLGRARVPDHADAVVADQDARALLADLSERDREILELAAWECLEPREIAEVLGVSANTVRIRLSRTRARLRGRSADPPDPADPAGSRHDPGAGGHPSDITPTSSPSRETR